MTDRELDALVAEKVFDMTFPRYPDGVEVSVNATPHLFRPTFRDGEFYPDGPPHYSTDIAAAWQVVEKLHPTLWCRIQTGQPLIGAPKAMGCTVWLGEYGEPKAIASGTADSVPLAICRAALAAVGAEVPT